MLREIIFYAFIVFLLGYLVFLYGFFSSFWSFVVLIPVLLITILSILTHFNESYTFKKNFLRFSLLLSLALFFVTLFSTGLRLITYEGIFKLVELGFYLVLNLFVISYLYLLFKSE